LPIADCQLPIEAKPSETASQRSSTCYLASFCAIWGENFSATDLSTSNVSIALQTPGRCTLAFQHNFLGHLQIAVRIHKDVADALVMFDDGKPSSNPATARMRLSPPRACRGHVLRERKQNRNRFRVGRRPT